MFAYLKGVSEAKMEIPFRSVHAVRARVLIAHPLWLAWQCTCNWTVVVAIETTLLIHVHQLNGDCFPFCPTDNTKMEPGTVSCFAIQPRAVGQGP